MIALLALAAAVQTVEAGKLIIGGEAFATAEVLDARAMPDIGGGAGLMITLTPAATKRLHTLTIPLAGKPLTITLDGQPVAALMIHGPVTDGVIDLPGHRPIAEAEALAKRISGKDPLPDDLSE